MTAIDLSLYQFSALIFDCDGTLANTAPLHHKSMASAVAEQGFTMERDWYYQRVGLSRVDLFLDFERDHGVSLDHGLAAQHSKDVFRTIVHRVQPIHATVATAQLFHGKTPMAVASGAEGEVVRATLSAIGITDMFSHIVTVSDVPIGKPAPDLFNEAARRLGVPARDCLVFEDSFEGLEAAKRAGMVAINVREIA